MRSAHRFDRPRQRIIAGLASCGTDADHAGGGGIRHFRALQLVHQLHVSGDHSEPGVGHRSIRWGGRGGVPDRRRRHPWLRARAGDAHSDRLPRRGFFECHSDQWARGDRRLVPVCRRGPAWVRPARRRLRRCRFSWRPIHANTRDQCLRRHCRGLRGGGWQRTRLSAARKFTSLEAPVHAHRRERHFVVG